MDPIDNPFVPGAGTPPPELVGREQLLEGVRVAVVRAQRGHPAKSLIAVGLRGVGKTVLLNRCQELAEAEAHLSIYIEAQEGRPLPRLLVPEVRKAVLALDRMGLVHEHVKRSMRALRSWVGKLKLTYQDIELALDIDPEPGLADSGDPEADLTDLFVALGRAAQARSRPICLLIDELQYLEERDFGALIMALHRVGQLGLPLLMVGAGLPLIVGLSGQAKSYAERLFDFPNVGPLSREDAAQAISAPITRAGVSIDSDAMEAILMATQGYPYFLQEWGYHAWNAGSDRRITAPDVERAQHRALQRLDQGFFRVRFDRLTPLEKDYLRAMAEIGPGPHRSGDIARMLNRATTDVGPRRENLIRKGMIWSPAHGDTAFTVPLFDEFMRRAMPGWSPPKRAARNGRDG
jgi:hypothetical protein